MAGWTGLEPATFCVTGRRSNQLSYHPVVWGRVKRKIRTGQVKSALAPRGGAPLPEASPGLGNPGAARSS